MTFNQPGVSHEVKPGFIARLDDFIAAAQKKIVSFRDALQLPDPLGDKTVLQFVIDPNIDVTMLTYGDCYIGMTCNIGGIERMSPQTWLELLTESGEWGEYGFEDDQTDHAERLNSSSRFAVVDQRLQLIFNAPVLMATHRFINQGLRALERSARAAQLLHD